MSLADVCEAVHSNPAWAPETPYEPTAADLAELAAFVHDGPHPDEAPELPDAEYHGAPDQSAAWWADQLGWLLCQLADFAGGRGTLAGLEADVAEARRHAGRITDADVIAATGCAG